MSERQFYIYYDCESLSIKAVSPIPQDEFAHLQVVAVPVEMGLKFLSGEESLDRWYIGEHDGKPLLTRSPLDFPTHDAGTIIHIQRAAGGSGAIQGVMATAYLANKRLEFKIPHAAVGQKLKHIEGKTTTFYLTKRNDPAHLIDSFEVDLDALIKAGSVQFPFKTEYKDLSLFTTKLFSKYSFDVKRGGWRPTETSSGRINKLVSYSVKHEMPEDFYGVAAKYDVNKGVVNLRVHNDCPIFAPNGSLLLFTKQYDPTVVLGAVKLDVANLISNQSVSIQVPSDIGSDFGIAGYPLAEQLIHVKE